MNLTAIFIAALSLVQPQTQVYKPVSTQTCQSLSSEMNTILGTKQFNNLEMDRELSGPRLQYIKMNCKDGEPPKSTDITFFKIITPYNILFIGMVDAPEFNQKFGFRDDEVVKTRISRYTESILNKNLKNVAFNKEFGCDKHLSEECNLLGINAIDNIL